MQIHRHEIDREGTHADLEKVTIRVPHQVAYQVQALAKSKRQSVSLYLSNILAKHVNGPSDDR